MSVVADNTYLAPDGTYYIFGGDGANCTLPACPVELSVYGYRASLPASISVIVLYAICMAAQIALGIKYRAWGFMSAMVTGCLVEILGYVGRILMWNNPWDDGGFIMQIVLITIGPVFFSAAIYVMLAQIAKYISPLHCRFDPKWYYYVFIPFDIICLVLQAIGGAMSSTSNGDSQTGVDIAMAGLILQVIVLSFFLIASVDYFVRARSVLSALRAPTMFKVFVAFLYSATILILIRCAYRIYELGEGYSRDSEALRDQPLFIALESVMVVVAAYCLIAAHPGPGLQSRQSVADQEKSSPQESS